MDKLRNRKSRSRTGIRGSKPTPLKVSKNSHNCIKIQPVIIYLRSPEVIHTQPKDFMAVVQRLTGCSLSCTQTREDLTALQTNPKAFCPLEKQDFSAYETAPAPPVWPNDYLSEVISPPWNFLPEELEFDMGWDKELHLFSPPFFQQYELTELQHLFSPPFFQQYELTELQPFNCLYDADHPYM
ncbi:hypothetical protein SUGI_1163390 [Cryptomeria japonica]|uniref:uncharacterized protein LOC131860424 n=1 Tax=Cryptomeria japonica TaxID=3369 RepID=UPI002414A9F0|nr:uncharacterized protein LOC131860424 [Cryptomeria japonica]GLJ54240.1 hypothetical protein SUGI_1163390 [Cryptomeria japonica]